MVVFHRFLVGDGHVRTSVCPFCPSVYLWVMNNKNRSNPTSYWLYVEHFWGCSRLVGLSSTIQREVQGKAPSIQSLIWHIVLGFFPGCVYLVTCWCVIQPTWPWSLAERWTGTSNLKFSNDLLGFIWWRTFESAAYSHLTSCQVSVFIGGFSSILAYGLIQMNGLGGLGGWVRISSWT